MKRLFGVLALLLLYASPVLAIVVNYQPTPFSLKKNNGSSMSQNVDIVHIWDGWIDSIYGQVFIRDDELQVGGWGISIERT